MCDSKTIHNKEEKVSGRGQRSPFASTGLFLSELSYTRDPAGFFHRLRNIVLIVEGISKGWLILSQAVGFKFACYCLYLSVALFV